MQLPSVLAHRLLKSALLLIAHIQLFLQLQWLKITATIYLTFEIKDLCCVAQGMQLALVFWSAS